ncbi:hypothetical protein CSV77_04940 [Sporosarcina sp. P16b]|uniref:hypothetical protein n=1 Tax=Sporosarcina sp. P16b TaxID=2048261 RepID=UPI000C65B2EA|nr:hypothetical protein [Sporosarcina sp. P16b]PIC71377.1 hypothetical protein CSV77_04940 [Sporosarcina sp. P16b]
MKLKKPRSPLKKIQSQAKRSVKKAVVPGYGKGGSTAMKNPAKYAAKKVTGQPLSKPKKKGFFSLFK